MAEKGSDQLLDRQVSQRETKRLAAMSGLAMDDFAELRLREVGDVLSDHGLGFLLGFRRICGRVVKRDPVTGELLAVPGATVEVQDTDCSFLTWAPGGGLMWLFPGLCHRETIATTITDECGNFCVWVPRWEVDWILRWRKDRICFPLERPRLIDFIEPELIDPAGPVIDPGWIDPAPEIRLRGQIEGRFGAPMAERVMTSLPSGGFGASRSRPQMLLDEFAPHFPPPTPDGSPKEILGDVPDPLGPVDWGTWVGPFIVCRDVWVPEWSTQIDVPDITFKVTQTIGGSDVTIYSEGFFDVRWNDTSGDVLLEASPAAHAVETCHGPLVECDDTPAITAASLMPLTAAYHDNTTGYGRRVNRRSADGTSLPSGTVANGHAPIADRLDLFGCAHIGDASHYRIVYSYEGGPQLPLTGFSWSARRAADGVVIPIIPGADGWVEIQDLLPPWNHLLTSWPTQRIAFGDGVYEMTLQTGSPGTVDAESGIYRFEVDNTYPHWDLFAVDYRLNGSAAWTTLDLTECPKIQRGPTDSIELKVRWQASAAHLRDAVVGFSGCSDSSEPSATSVLETRRWWWQVETQNTTGPKEATWLVEPDDEAGCYTVSGTAVSRSYNPGAPAFDPSSDFFELDARRKVHRSRAISIVDSAP